MATCTRSSGSETPFQSFPQRGRLKKTLNVNLAALRRRLASESNDVHPYVVASVKYETGRFIQTGSGPNFQGGLITLCTCKHQMRSWHDTGEWLGRWIAGFTGVGTVDRGNYLVYLMKIGDAYTSHLDLWSSTRVPRKVKQVKAAHLNRLGDVFEPRSIVGAPNDPRSYVPPRNDHSHARNSEWHRDIAYGSTRPAALLVGDPELSFLWDRPLLRLPGQLPRNPSCRSIHRLLEQLELVNHS